MHVQALQEEEKAAEAQFNSLRAVLKVLKEQNHKLVKAGMVSCICSCNF